MKLQFIKEQAQVTRQQTLAILEQTPVALWNETPAVIESNIAWQVGHLIVSQFYHAIAVIAKPEKSLYEAMPLSEYFRIYSMFTKSTTNDLQPSPETLLHHLEIVNTHALRVINRLREKDLAAALEPTQFPHPLATNKYEALTWSFRHEMWHLGQIAVLRRILGDPIVWH